MDDATALTSRLVRAANTADRMSHVEVRRLLEYSIRMIRRLRSEAQIIPIPGKDALVYLGTVAAGADRVASEEWRHALLAAAEMVRDLNVIIESGTIVTVVNISSPS